MPVPKLPSALQTGSILDLPDLAGRVYRWTTGAYGVLQALRTAVESELVRRDGASMLGNLALQEHHLTGAGLIQGTPRGFRFSSNSAVLDVSAKNDHQAENTLTGNSTLVLANGYDGCQGLILVKQDGTGSRTLSFTATGWTILREDGSSDSNPKSAADAVTLYTYLFCTVALTPYCLIVRVKTQ